MLGIGKGSVKGGGLGGLGGGVNIGLKRESTWVLKRGQHTGVGEYRLAWILERLNLLS